MSKYKCLTKKGCKAQKRSGQKKETYCPGCRYWSASLKTSHPRDWGHESDFFHGSDFFMEIYDSTMPF